METSYPRTSSGVILISTSNWYCGWVTKGDCHPSDGGKTNMWGPSHGVQPWFPPFSLIKQSGEVRLLQIPEQFWAGSRNLKLDPVTRSRIREEWVFIQGLQVRTPHPKPKKELLAFLSWADADSGCLEEGPSPPFPVGFDNSSISSGIPPPAPIPPSITKGPLA